MNSKDFTAGLRDLRGLRDDIKELRRELAQLEADRDKQIAVLGGYEKAKADRIAPAAGLSVADVVALVPSLGPQKPATAPPTASAGEAPADHETAAHSAVQPSAVEGAAAPDLRHRATEPAAAAPPAAPDVERSGAEEPVDDDGGQEQPPAVPVPAPAAAPVSAGPVGERTLPSIPVGEAGDAWFGVTPGLASKRPTFTQQARQMAFLDTGTGVLVHRDQTVRLDLGTGSVGEILTAVYATVPASVERIYITGGDPWHRDAERYPFLRDAVAAWLNAPLPEGWTVESTRGRDRLAGHLVHERRPVGRWQRGDQHTEIRSVGEWFDPAGADPATVRDAFVLLWQELRRHWSDVVLMGAPSQTGRDLWTRTIPAKPGSRWAEGYPVMSEEVRGLLHATAGQGRTELLTPPHVPATLPQLTELDRTFAYAKHTWASGVGAPRRVTAHTFAAMTEKEQVNALYAPSHWHIRVTVPDGWDHVGLLPAPAAGDKAWHYPAEGGRTFTTWAGGAEVNLALRNPIAPWKVEILDGLLWESGTPLREWSTRLKDAWSALQTLAATHGDERQRLAAHLASRGVRSILLYGIGGFAQRPRITTGSTPVGREHEVPAGAQIIGSDATSITWQRHGGFSRDPNAHPEWAAGVWSAARAALLSTRAKTPDGATAHVGALHLPARSVVAFRTDAIYTTARPDWPYHGQPGDYLLKGHLPMELTAPTTEDDLLTLQSLGRAHLADQQQGAGR
ncbi:Mucin-19 [Streptomyces sp. RKND-216]|uniref:Mucin-19 n=1 Tax=Streptomyces sp. RKND-216 TaxID=2562581 RepID=UPI00109E1467|nr:Mucin-19 [Streptomyces sp. RKND-216]THA28241.1 Mucin-19 [Streptomyces sp. RKND-216]